MMKLAPGTRLVFLRLLPAAFGFGLLLLRASAQPVINNPSFEADARPSGPGYGAITGWAPGGGIDTGYGINDASGPFADNGAIPHGNHVLFMQNNGTLSQDVSGFRAGAQYWLRYLENARFNCCGGSATLSVAVGGNIVIAHHRVTAVGGANPYRAVNSAVFTAPADTLRVIIEKRGAGDVTALIDHIQIIEIPPNTPPVITQQPEDQLTGKGEAAIFAGAAVGTAPLFFQWRFNGIDLAGETNTTLTITNIEANQDGTYSFVVTNTAGSATSSNATLGFRSGGPGVVNASFETDSVPPGAGYGAITGWVPGGEISTGYGINELPGPFADNGAIPHGTKVAFIQNNGTLSQDVSGFTVGAKYWLAYRENARANCCGGTASLTVTAGGSTVVTDHPVTPVGGLNPYRIVTSSLFTASATNLTITFIKAGTGDTTVLIDDVQIFSGKTPPMINAQPQSQTARQSDTVTFTVAALGISPLTYQWFFKSLPMPGQTNATLRLVNVTPADSGTYTVTINSPAGTTISVPAELTVAPPLELGITLQPGNGPAVHIDGIPGRLVTLEYKDSLAPGTQWLAWTNLTLSSGSTVVVDGAAPAFSPRFYRAQQVP